MKTKICTICNKELKVTEFNKGNDNDGLYYWCKKCGNEYSKEYYESHKEETKKQQKKYRETHKDESAEYRKIHRIEKVEYSKKYFQTHKLEHKKWKLRNKIKIAEQRKKHLKNRYSIDINFKILTCLRNRLYAALCGKDKSKHTIELLGCSIENLKKHLENQFKLGMSWSNYGTGWNGRGMQEWHIDHIRPCSSFDLSNSEEQCKCFHYTNLQPLWAIDNLNKSRKS